jgi:hypothetical protein
MKNKFLSLLLTLVISSCTIVHSNDFTMIKIGGSVDKIQHGNNITTVEKLNDEKSFQAAADVGSMSVITRNYLTPFGEWFKKQFSKQ